METIHKVINGYSMRLRTSCDHYRAMSDLHDQLLKTITDITGEAAPWQQRSNSGPVRKPPQVYTPRQLVPILPAICGRVFVKTTLAGLMSAFPFASPGDAEGLGNEFPRWNGAPGQDYPIIVSDVVREPDIRGMVFMRANWGFTPRWSKERAPGGKRPPINARCEGISTNGLFKRSYRERRALMPINGFFEWKDIYGTGKNKQPYAIAMKDGGPFALAAIWDSWRDPATGLELRTFAVVTCGPNELMATIHDRMPVILQREDYERWLGSDEDPRDLMKPFPADQMTMWPIGKKVGAYANNTPDILDPLPPEPAKDEPPAGAKPDDDQPSLF